MESLIKQVETWSVEKKTNTCFIAMDEVGRGSFFGPVSVGGVIFPAAELINREAKDWHLKVRDSKKLSPAVRKKLSVQIQNQYLCHVSHVSVGFIDKYNINKAIQYGVYRVFNYLKHRVSQTNPGAEIALILLDGNYRFLFPQIRMTRPVPPIKTIIKGDDSVFHISCASIVAKESRDQMLREGSGRFPAYNLDRNAGYGTAQHRGAIAEFGPTRFHRREYVKKIAVL